MNIWVKRGLLAVAGGLWFTVTFAASLWLTFPSERAAQFVQWKVEEQGQYLLQVEEVSPYWLGARLDGVSLYTVKKSRRAEQKPKTNLMFSADSVRARVGLWSLLNLGVLGGNGTIKGSISRQGGDFDIQATVSRLDEGVQVRALRVIGEGMPISAVPMPDAKLIGTGGLDLDIDLEADEGFSKSEGKISVVGKDVVITSVEAAALEGFPLGPLNISNVDLQLDVKSGKAKVGRGQIVSDMVTVDVEGEVILNDNLSESRLRLKFIVTLGDTAAMLKGFLKDAEHSDGKFHYALSGSFEKPKFKAERERRSRAGGVDRERPSRDEEAGDEESDSGRKSSLKPDLSSSVRERLGGDDPDAAREERRKRREQAIADRRARLAERRKQREDDGGGSEGEVRPPRFVEDDEEPMPEDFPPAPEEPEYEFEDGEEP